MTRAILIAALLTLLTATMAAASMPGVAWFSDGFTAFTDGQKLNANPPGAWTGSGPENKIYTNQVRMRGYSGAGTSSSEAMTTGVGALSAGKLAIFHMKVRGEQGGTNPGNHAYMYLRDTTGANIAFWYGTTSSLVPRWGGTVGTAVSLSDGLWHDLDIRYNPVNGVTDWIADGATVWTQTLTAGLAADKISLDDTARAASTTLYDNVWVDEVGLGTVPEPSSLLAFATFGVGALGFARRRRA